MWRDDGKMSFASRRSPVLGRHGMVASSQPLASQAGLDILKKGGNAVDAAVCMAAVLNVTEPCSTGLGGDMFMLYYEGKSKKVYGLNGSGKSPQALTLEKARAEAMKEGSDEEMDSTHIHCVTVPGTAAGWVDSVARFGSGQFGMPEVLAPAIALAEEGFPVSPVTAFWWAQNETQLNRPGNNQEELLSPATGKAPTAGEVFRNPTLAQSMRDLAEGGKDGFYGGRVGQAIVELVQAQGGTLTLEDLKAHESLWVDEPISTTYGPVRVWEIPPNGQGLTALLALNLLASPAMRGKLEGLPHNSANYLHVLLEAMRLAFADTRYYVADPQSDPAPLDALLSPEYAAERAQGFDLGKAQADVEKGTPTRSSSTVSFQVVDAEGNAVSFVNSNYMYFGSGLVPKGCGFTLQNRGHNFSPLAGHPNALAPGKRPYHTIIPGLATLEASGDLFATFTNMGGFMQPQVKRLGSGHVQILLNMLQHGMDPQAAVDCPRFCIKDGTAQGAISFEEGIHDEVVEELRRRGHVVLEEERTGYAHHATFGKAQIITRDVANGVLWAGSDGRGDGCAMGW